MEPVITYRRADTGVWSYHFYLGRQYIGKAMCELSRFSLVRIETDIVSWYSTFQMNTDYPAYPGVSRKVMDNGTGLEVFRIVFCEPGFYRILGGDVNLVVECRGDAYLFGNPGQPVLAMTERIREWPWVPAGEPFFKTTIYEENVPAELLTAMLAMPAVKF